MAIGLWLHRATTTRSLTVENSINEIHIRTQLCVYTSARTLLPTRSACATKVTDLRLVRAWDVVKTRLAENILPCMIRNFRGLCTIVFHKIKKIQLVTDSGNELNAESTMAIAIALCFTTLYYNSKYHMVRLPQYKPLKYYHNIIRQYEILKLTQYVDIRINNFILIPF